MDKPNKIEYRVFGRYALFTDPLSKTGGEKCSYQIPTYQALKGITESIYWKPTITWVIDECRIMNLIQMESKGIRPVKYNEAKNDLAYYTYLSNVEYRVRAHFEWNENREDLAGDRNENKHYDIARRMVERGGRRDIFLGTRECQGYVEPCAFEDGESAYQDIKSLSFGIMVHGITYPDEAVRQEEKGKMTVRLWNVQMKKGIIHFPHPEQCQIRQVLRDAKQKEFFFGRDFNGLKEFEGGEAFGMAKDFS
ncbi:MAG: type I-C CRISPR-associated protein Cas5c [Blautia sp.]|nr:type I-C CRISPR-associated protein Cas5c [Blautia sp.]MCM1201096.1 type I-C CRISPR-associated protein Cas5c [Bacteroides fragilis]